MPIRTVLRTGFTPRDGGDYRSVGNKNFQMRISTVLFLEGNMLILISSGVQRCTTSQPGSHGREQANPQCSSSLPYKSQQTFNILRNKKKEQPGFWSVVEDISLPIQGDISISNKRLWTFNLFKLHECLFCNLDSPADYSHSLQR